jgi:uncharacterized protein YgiM (DUF1202 family)
VTEKGDKVKKRIGICLALVAALALSLCVLAGCQKKEQGGEQAAATDVLEQVGTLEDITMSDITIRTNDGRVLDFAIGDARHTFSYGIDEGNWVTVVYTGKITGEDTSKATVIEVHDEETDLTREVKSQTVIEDVDETVYALEDVNVHDSYMMASNTVGVLKARESVKRTGHCNNGWDRIVFKGNEAYVYGTLLTTDPNEAGIKGTTKDISQQVNIKALDETVYAKTDATIRRGYSTSSEAIGALKAGASIKRTGICDNGWSRVVFNNAPAFIYSDLLTTKNPNSESDGVKITAVSETVYLTADTPAYKTWSEKSESLGTLKSGLNVVRTGICDNGWSRVAWKGSDAYVKSNVLSKKNPSDGSDATIYVTKGKAWTTTDANVRKSPSVKADKLGVLKKGTEVKITGVADNSWSRIVYKDGVGFVHNDLLTSTDPNPKKDEKKDKVKPDPKPAPAPAPDPEPQPTPDPDPQPAPDPEPEPDPDPEPDPQPAPDPEPDPQPAPDPDDQGDQGDDQGDQGDKGTGDQGDDEGSQDEEPAVDPFDQLPDDAKSITGTIVGYDVESITIEIEEAKPSAENKAKADDEPALTGDSDEYPSITYEEADGKVTTCYTFDTRNAPQVISASLAKGIKVKVYYEGDLSDMSNVKALLVTDRDVK